MEGQANKLNFFLSRTILFACATNVGEKFLTWHYTLMTHYI